MDGRQVEKGGHYRGLIRGGGEYADAKGGDDLDDGYRQTKYIDIEVVQRSLASCLCYILVRIIAIRSKRPSSGSSCSSSRSSFIWLVIHHQARQQDIRIRDRSRRMTLLRSLDFRLKPSWYELAYGSSLRLTTFFLYSYPCHPTLDFGCTRRPGSFARSSRLPARVSDLQKESDDRKYLLAKTSPEFF